MPTDADYSLLEASLSELATRLARQAAESAPDQEALRDVFGVNNEIGRLSKMTPSLRPALVDLQARLNLVTIELKRGNKLRAREAFGDVERKLTEIKKSHSAP